MTREEMLELADRLDLDRVEKTRVDLIGVLVLGGEIVKLNSEQVREIAVALRRCAEEPRQVDSMIAVPISEYNELLALRDKTSSPT